MTNKLLRSILPISEAIKVPRPKKKAMKLLKYLVAKKKRRVDNSNLFNTLLPHGSIEVNSMSVGHIRENMKIPHHLLASSQTTVGYKELISKLEGDFEQKYHAETPTIPIVVWNKVIKKFVVDDGNHRANVARLTRTPLRAHVFFPIDSIPEHLRDRMPINVGPGKKYPVWSQVASYDI